MDISGFHLQAMQTTVYESTINEMQIELDKRLDEISASKDEDTEVIRLVILKLSFNIVP